MFSYGLLESLHMPDVLTVECTNPESVRLKVTVELSLGEWTEIAKLLSPSASEPIRYYRPLDAIGQAARRAIEKVRARLTEPLDP